MSKNQWIIDNSAELLSTFKPNNLSNTLKIIPIPTLLFSKQNRLINWGIKALVFLLLSWVLYRQVLQREDIQEIWQLFVQNLSQQNPLWLVMAILLMPFNWLAETYKWRSLILTFENISFWKSFKAVLTGVTFSIFTPNRIGEYGGRILFVASKNNWRAVIATLVGSYGQLVAILTGGIIGLTFFGGRYFDLDVLVVRSLLFLGIALIALLLFCFYNIEYVIPLIARIPYVKRLVKSAEVLRSYTSKTLTTVLLFAFLRYLIYSIQYYLMLCYFGIEVDVWIGLAGIATVFLIQTSIPLPPLIGLITRGEIALLVWSNFEGTEIGILAATFLLWILNLILPALVGTVFMININVLKTLGYEKENH